MIPVFITARTGSSRLPFKHFKDLDGYPVIDFIVRRCVHFGLSPIVCVPIDDMAEFAEYLPPIPIYGGDPDNIETRLRQCAAYFKINHFHHLDGDDPLFCPETVMRSMDYGYSRKILPPLSSWSGTGLCGTSYLLDAPDRKRILSDVTGPWPLRLTLDYEEDLHLIRTVVRIVGGYMAPRSAIDKVFYDNPQLHQVNWFRTKEWKERQDNERQPGLGIREAIREEA